MIYHDFFQKIMIVRSLIGKIRTIKGVNSMYLYSSLSIILVRYDF